MNIHHTMKAAEIKPTATGWRWFGHKAQTWLTYWSGGEDVNFYGPFQSNAGSVAAPPELP